MSDAIQQVIRGEFDKALANMQALSADAALHAQLEQAVALCIEALRDALDAARAASATRPVLDRSAPPARRSARG